MTMQTEETTSSQADNTLPPDVRDLLTAEKVLPPAPDGADARIWARIESSLGALGTPAATATAAAPTTSGWLIAGGLAAAALVTLAVVMFTTSGTEPDPTAPFAVGTQLAVPTQTPAATPTPAPTPAATPAPAQSPTPTQAPTPAPEPTPTQAPAQARSPSQSPTPEPAPTLAPEPTPTPAPTQAPEPTQAPTPAAAPPRPPSDPIAERKILTRAQVAMRSNDAATALSAVAEHQRLYPRGELAEERESLAIVALHANGQTERARDRATRFRARFPNSIYATALERLGL